MQRPQGLHDDVDDDNDDDGNLDVIDKIEDIGRNGDDKLAHENSSENSE